MRPLVRAHLIVALMSVATNCGRPSAQTRADAGLPNAEAGSGGADTPRDTSGTSDATDVATVAERPTVTADVGDAAADAEGANADRPVPRADAGPSTGIQCNGRPLPPRAQGKSGPYVVGPEGARAAGLEPYWPTIDWRTADAASLGFDVGKLDAAVGFRNDSTNTLALLVIRHGYVALERYSGGATRESRHPSYSMAKSYASALIGLLIREGKVPSVDEPLCRYYPNSTWTCAPDDPHSKITLRHAMTMTTGLRWNEDWRTGKQRPTDFSVAAVLAAPIETEPGVKVRYSTGDAALLQGAIERASGTSVLQYARQSLLDPIGSSDLQWTGATAAGITATAREYAKLGYLYLNRGKWNERQIVPEAWVEDSTQALHDADPAPDPDPCHDWYHYLWHVNLPNRLGSGVDDPACPVQFCDATTYADLPRDGYFAEGINGQFIFVVPSADLVVVRLARDSMGIEKWDAWARGFLVRLLDAIAQ